MATANILVYGLLLIPFLGTLFAGYGRIKVGPFFGLTVAGGAASILLNYLLLDLTAALIQLGALAVGSILFLLSIGIFGEKVSYRSSMLLLATVALFPFGLIASSSYWTPAIVYGIVIVLNILFAMLFSYLRRNSLAPRKGKERPQRRYMLTIPTVASTVVAGLMVLNSFSQGTLF